MRVSFRNNRLNLHHKKRSGGRFTKLKGIGLPLMFMEAAGSHRSTADRAKSRRRMAHGKLAEVTASAESGRCRIRVEQQPRREYFSFAERIWAGERDLGLT